ncbi:hypothetical protein EQM14_04995 [Caproiciproducens sp. NJN-50]|uniref:hypothetical protein n=1 Tax=Caproiciproducens sp. NJN-50 TaxID=2507162 RepID=UPI000FFE0DD8|nr:hypothetical protein [Caproiciproducens sp. NJN-50]QAT49182.1 hypothetical protein EQM14_04995 [Caproiciproducens sp. NJN-50]
MPEQSSQTVFHSVSCRPFDGGGEGDVLLSGALEKAFSDGLAKGLARGVENGRVVRARYKIGGGEFRWRKTSGRTVVQESFRRPDGFRLITRNLSGAILSEAAYGRDLGWLRSAYFTADTGRPEVLLRPDGDGLELLEFDAGTGRYRREKLLSCPVRPGTAAQSYVNSAAGGEPRVLARTGGGLFCYCGPAEREKRLALFRRLEENGGVPDPDWTDTGGDARLEFSYIRNDGSESRRQEAGKEEPEAVPAFAAGAVLGASVRASEDLDSSDYAVDREIFSVEPADPRPIPNPVPAPKPGPIPNPAPAPSPAPVKYSVAAKGLGGKVIHARELDRKSARIEPLFGEGLIPAKRIVVSEEESYLYFGSLIGGLRQGQGRTQMENGHTAYEGGYLGDKRDGFGVYYYQSGKLCYAGNWKRNLRDGMGVAFGSSDGSVFIGRWKDGIPTGRGSAFDMDGNLLYTGEWKDGKPHGTGTEYRGGQVVRSGQWRGGRFDSGWSRREPDSPGEEQTGAVD